MNNPFEKHNHNGLIGGILIGTVVAGAIAYLFLTDAGASLRKELADQFDRFTGNATEAEEDDYAMDYLKKRTKAPKTDREVLAHHQIIN